MLGDAVRTVLEQYPKIFFACHVRHVHDTHARRTLSAHQASILDHLDSVAPTSLTDLARHMGVTSSTMSLNVDRLERQGYVVRGKDSEDGRRIGLLLTRAGARIKEQEKVLDPELLRGMLKRLPAAELEAAIRGLVLLGRAAQDTMHARHAARPRPAATSRRSP